MAGDLVVADPGVVGGAGGELVGDLLALDAPLGAAVGADLLEPLDLVAGLSERAGVRERLAGALGEASEVAQLPGCGFAGHGGPPVGGGGGGHVPTLGPP